MKITAIINSQDGQVYIEFRDDDGILIDQKVVDEIQDRRLEQERNRAER